MRVNIYSQELTSEVKLVTKESDGRVVVGLPCFPNGEPNGRPRRPLERWEVDRWLEVGRPQDMLEFTNPYRYVCEESVVYHAAQLMLHSSPMLHHPPMDDDRSAVTFWLPRSKLRREEMARAFERIAQIFREAPPDSGID